MAFLDSDLGDSGGSWEELPERSTPRARTPPTNSWRSSYQYVTTTPHPNMLGPSGHFVPRTIQTALDPNSGLDVDGNPLDGTLPIRHGNEAQQEIELNSESPIKYQFNGSDTDLGRGFSAATADTSESIHGHPEAPNEEGDALAQKPEGSFGASHPGLERSGGKGLSISRWVLRRKAVRDAPVGNDEGKIGFRQRIRNMFQQ